MKPQKQIFWKRHLPNIITWGRIAAIPAVMYFLQFDDYDNGLKAAVIFIAASISDYFDGYFARIYNVETRTGQFLDPVADKLLVTAGLIMLIPLHRVSAVLVVLLLSRDLMINALRAVAAGQRVVMKTTWTAKWKTGAQMTAIPFLMLKTVFGYDVLLVGQVLLWIAFILSVISAVDYLRSFMAPPET
jgi:CDP-diacylglycerol--glycerol-3-phosphate 3-phosphatidyltransferase